MTRLVKDLLEISRVRRSEIELWQEELRLADVVQRIATSAGVGRGSTSAVYLLVAREVALSGGATL